MDIDCNHYAETIDKWFVNLDEAVINALELYKKEGLPNLDLGDYKFPLGIGSGNAAETIKILLNKRIGTIPVLASESTFESELDDKGDKIDGAILLSASGEKSAPGIARTLVDRDLEVRLLTCNPKASSIDIVGKGNAYVFPKIPEPYTYNTSTYLGMVLSKTREDPGKILDYIREVVDPLLERFNLTVENHPAYYFIIPGKFDILRNMLETKFVELFSDKINRDFFTPEHALKHATDVVRRHPQTLYVSIGYDNQVKGTESNRLNIPLPESAGYGSAIVVGYYFVGKIQQANPSWFKNDLIEWCKQEGHIPLVE
jgi:hypothetical protein